MSFLEDFKSGNNSAEQLSATMADGIKTFPFIKDAGGYNYNNDTNPSNGYMYGATAVLDKAIPVTMTDTTSFAFDKENGVFYILNGSAEEFYSFNLNTKIFTQLQEYVSERLDYTHGIVRNGKVYFIGFHNTSVHRTNERRIYDIDSDTWSADSMIGNVQDSASRFHVEDSNNDDIYIMQGGTTTIKQYTLSTNTIIDLPPLVGAVARCQGAFKDGLIYLLGNASSDVRTYNVTTHATSLLFKMPHATNSSPLCSLLLYGNKLYIRPQIDKYFTVYNIDTKVKQIAYLGAGNKRFGGYVEKETEVIFQDKIFTFGGHCEGYETNYTDRVKCTDLKVPHFYNVTKES